jgi:probable addiction module antidote protein
MKQSTVFIGGSRHVSYLPEQVRERLNNIIESKHSIVVGDANGADKAVQKYLNEAGHKGVMVFCSGDQPRNNLGRWPTHNTIPPKGVRGFQFYAAKDREMAREADFGLMIWDGKSAGTILNVLRLVGAGKIAVLVNVAEKTTINIKSRQDWDHFLAGCSPELIADLRERATPGEWGPVEENLVLELDVPASVLKGVSAPPSEDELAAVVNAALAAGDSTLVIDTLGNIARARGMTRIAKETGLARESLYRSLTAEGNPEFATVIKVMAALGLRLEASKTRSEKAA